MKIKKDQESSWFRIGKRANYCAKTNAHILTKSLIYAHTMSLTILRCGKL